jgi:ribosome recycling factor
MQDQVNNNFREFKEQMDAAISHLHDELRKIRAGRASATILDGVLVDYYGNPTPISQVANIATMDARTINIQPWEKKMVPEIEKAIFAANLGVTPLSDGENVKIVIPPLTEERRLDLVRQVKAGGEDCKISLRNARHKALDFIKKAVKDHYPEDAGKREEGKVEKQMEAYTNMIQKIIDQKEQDILTV